MKKIKIMSIMVVIICVIGGSWLIMNQKDKNNVQNVENEIKYSNGKISGGDFEEGTNEYWTSYSTKDSVLIIEQQAYSGEKSMKIGLKSDYTSNVVQHINNLKPGYYFLEAQVLNDGNQDYCYLYGNGTEQGQCMTAIPKAVTQGEWTKVTVRGIKVENDGILEIGINSQGSNQYLYIDDIQLKYETNQDSQYESLYGGAISWLDWVEDLGGKYYYADGKEGDALQIMAENGCNFVRLELYNNPGDYVNKEGDAFPRGYKDADAIYDLAVRAHNKGMKIQLSFMYSDYWGNDAIPSDWVEKIDGVADNDEKVEILTECIYEYTKNFMKRLADEGIYPEYVSIGNEMNGGILTPYGSTCDSQESLQAFKKFMDAGYRAIKEVSNSSKVVLHIACNGDDLFWESKVGTGMWFFKLCEENDIKYDVIGTSYYPFWGQTDSEYAIKKAISAKDMIEWCNMMIDTFDKDILVMETGINWGTPGQLENNGVYEGIYKYTPQDQRNYMYELINALKSVKDGRCVGALYWDPILVRQEGIGYAIKADGTGCRPNCVETTTFFDYAHIALPVLDAYRYNVVNDGSVALYGELKDEEGKLIANENLTIMVGDNSYEVMTDRYGAYYMNVYGTSGYISVEGGKEYEFKAKYGDKVKIDLKK